MGDTENVELDDESGAVEAIRSLRESAVELRNLAGKLGELQRALLVRRERLLRSLPANDA